MTGFDDEIRDALAGGRAEPARPAFDDVRRRARAQQRRLRAVAGSGLALALVAVGGLAWALADDEGERTNVITDSPTTSTSTPPGSTTTTAAAVEPAPPGPRPTTVLVVTDDGHVRMLDVASGATVAELGRYEPYVDDETGMSSYIDDVALTPDGATTYVSLCCEPAAGWVLQVPTDGSAALDPTDTGQSFGNVWLVRPGPLTPARLAVAMYSGISVTTAAVGVDAAEFTDPDVSWPANGQGASTLQWSPDEQRLVWTETDATTVVVGTVVSDQEVRVTARLDAPEGAQWREATVRRDGNVVLVESRHEEADRAVVVDPISGEPVADFPLDGAVVSLGYDPSGTWLLVVYDDGRLVGMGGGETFTVATDIARADW